jgi:hypothetical protein
LFYELPPDSTGVNFINKLTFDKVFNIYTYRNFYNGGGVGLGDLNNDGLIDIYLVSNQGPNKLYLNKGDFKFEDITDKAGVAGTKAWSTGVSFADVNGDGWLDIYLCNSGDIKGDNKENELFINNHDLTFTESALTYGVADKGFTTHAVFFDYDKDNDLDLYILNNSFQAIGSFNLRKNQRPQRDPLGGDKLLRNDNGKYVDVSEQAGIYGSVIGFGLGVTVGDVDNDGWSDIYVSNDFFERDYLYVNNHDGSFREVLTEQMKSISGASMGADLADINNDGNLDIFVTEMLPQSNARLKTVTTFENWDRYQYSVTNDYHHQFTRNMLQLNNGNSTFSEIGRFSGVEATDWSWSALMFDMDNDGLKDIFVANGIYQDLTDQDYLQYISNEDVVRSIISGNGVDYKKLVELIPSTPVPDFAFHNEGNLQFRNMADEWGLGKPNFSNGAAYGDLDNDGDLDLVINKVNDVASVIRNQTDRIKSQNHYLKFELTGLRSNTFAIGTRIEILHKEKSFVIEQMPNRGFESSVDPRLNVGLGDIDIVDLVRVQWPDGKITTLGKVRTNQVLKLRQADAVEAKQIAQPSTTQRIFEHLQTPPVMHRHQENAFVDFDRDKLVYHMLSTEGPGFAKGDVNGDGLEDFYIGGSKNESRSLYLQQADGTFRQSAQEVFEADRTSEDVASLMFDADNDNDLDLYVCSGSNEFSSVSPALADRLYINDSKGNFSKSPQYLPTTTFESSSCVKAADYDSDGDLDLFIGIRSQTFAYGVPMNGYLLNNDGKGIFTNVSATTAPGLKGVGMITDASWSDIDGDKDFDLIIVGDYMPVSVFVNEAGKFLNKTELWGLGKSNGWWNKIEAADLDKDGDVDFVVGNHGLNSRFRASSERPVSMFVKDFDENGSIEQIITSYIEDKNYPILLRHDLISQLPSLKKKYLKYESFKDQTITDIFSEKELKDALKLNAYQLASGIFINQSGKFEFKTLPMEAQFSTVHAICIDDFDKDGNVDILVGGNLYGVKPQAGRYDASYGAFLKGNGRGNFNAVSAQESGLDLDGQIRQIVRIKSAKSELLGVVRNNDTMEFFSINHP